MFRDVYVSINTLNGRKNKISDIIDCYIQNDIKYIELGSTNCYQPNIMDYIYNRKKTENVKFIIHNYFPPVSRPLVINLASDSEIVRSDSISFIKMCIDASKELGSELYSFHAGFRSDPGLDFKYSNSKINEYNKAYRNFYNSIIHINKYAKESGIRLAIENNQASLDVKDYVMFYDSTDFVRLFEDIDDVNIGVHLDVGHLKVAAGTFDFDPMSFLLQFKDRIFSMHLHDNNGKEDLHKRYTKESWFIEGLKHLDDSVIWTIESHNQDVYDIKEMVQIIQNI